MTFLDGKASVEFQIKAYGKTVFNPLNCNVVHRSAHHGSDVENTLENGLIVERSRRRRDGDRR